ncbi:hypothetical protein AX768_13350 [Burkholderia sp. PAMC 28687]|uniref:hypothetical protein n=1 Tax=Burkholderia sp. PAMC 28687 TaxID=1795874 RepID=UPI000785FCDD|nr:hypothetical protein [Burkholderia sp. PAMC 28687]AMM14935.1 hypothetical protein AX768_13350 [Burkholderia sp. PAMC 28687]
MWDANGNLCTELSKIDTETLENTPKGYAVVPSWVHSIDNSQASVLTERLKTDKFKAAKTLVDYAKEIRELAATADILARVWEIDAPAFARIATNAKSTVKNLNGIADAATVIQNAQCPN